jgi:hypothetical protein
VYGSGYNHYENITHSKDQKDIYEPIKMDYKTESRIVLAKSAYSFSVALSERDELFTKGEKLVF